MDAMSEVIRAIRGGAAHARLIRESGSWGVRYPAFSGSGFHIVLDGTGWLVPPVGPPVALSQGDVVLAPFGAEHGFSYAPRALSDLPIGPMGPFPPSPGPADFEVLCGAYRLPVGQPNDYFRMLPGVITVSPDYERQPQLRSLAALLSADITQTQPGAQATRAALLDLIIVHALRQWQEDNGGADWPLTTDEEVAAALREIHTNPSRLWTVQELSDHVGLSRAAFAKRFSAAMGKTPMRYLIGWRVACGARLLLETTAPLATIAHQVGYSTEFAFAAAFRREYRISPGRFRHDMTQADDLDCALRVSADA
jgi:AraC-like DNA-binding protein